MKELAPRSRARYALLVAALACRNEELVLATMRELGLRIEGCSEAFAATACHILFDTRMDMPEAFMSPMHPEAHEFRSASQPAGHWGGGVWGKGTGDGKLCSRLAVHRPECLPHASRHHMTCCKTKVKVAQAWLRVGDLRGPGTVHSQLAALC